MKKNVFVTAVAGAMAAALAAPALAQTQQAPPQPPPAAATQAPQTPPPASTPAPAQAGAATPYAPQTPFPTTPSKQYVTPGARIDMTLQDAVQRAAQNNIDIGVARITPRLTDYTVAGLEAGYHLNLTANENTQRTSRFPTQTTQGISGITPTTTEGWSGGFAKNMWRGGGSWNLNFTNTRINQPATIAIRNPTFNSSLSGAYVQPLLRGFKIDATRAAISTDRIGQQNDEITLTTTQLNTDASVRNAYWDLVYAIQAVDAAQVTLDISNTLVQQNQQRVEIGTLAPIDVTSARAEAANNQLAVVQAQANLRTAELTLKRLIVNGTDDPVWTSSINPVDRPAIAPQPLNVDAALARALRERTDLKQSLNNLKISDVNLQLQQDQTRPQLNLTASYGLSGVGGPQFVQSTNTTIPSGYFDAIRNLYGLDAPQWNISLAFAYPLGVSAQETAVARSKLALEQSQANLKALQLQIATDVTSAALNVQSTLESSQAASVARDLAKQKLDAAQSKLDVGMATNYEVVQAQRDYSDAQNSELRAIANYRKALVAFEAAQTVGTRAVSAAVSGGGGGTTTTTGTSTTGSSSTGSTSSGGTSSGGSSTSGGGGL